MQPGRPTLFATKINYYFGLPETLSLLLLVSFLIVTYSFHAKFKNKIKSHKISHNYKKNPNLTELRREQITDLNKIV